MILQALYNYYEAMNKLQLIAPPGREYKAIAWAIIIKEDGSFVRLKPLKDTSDKNSKGKEYLVIPAVGRTSGIEANHLWDKKMYILGIDKGSKTKRSQDALNLFVGIVNSFAELYPENKSFKAVQQFYSKGLYKSPEVLESFKDVNETDWISFQLKGSTGIIASDNDALSWAEEQLSSGKIRGLCLITGLEGPLVEKHTPIQLPDSKRGDGTPLVSFNQPAFCSYGRSIKDLDNAPISKYAAFAYATAFNSLCDNPNTHYDLGSIRYVFWNSDVLNESINNTFRDVAFVDYRDKQNEDEESAIEDDKPKRKKRSKEKAPNPTQETRKLLEQFKAIRGNRGKGQHWEDERQFYIIGATGGGRGAIKYWQQGTVSEIFDRVYQHLVDMNIISRDGLVDEENPPLRSLYEIVSTVSPVSTAPSSQKFQLNLVQSIVESILNGTPYPLTLQQACISRIPQILRQKPNKEKKEYKKRFDLCAAILKGCINRKARIYKQLKELDMALDKQNDNIAYLAGRLFAVLEQIQQASLGKGVNATIRDRFYTSASTRPNMVMGRLIALSNHHLSKLRKEKPGLAVNLEKLLGEIFALIPAEVPTFPATFSLDEQSLFAVGYYHQKVDTYKKEDTNNSTEETEQ
ncbi:type I-C CRISPR-associated protein Cas8c/Csd1 [Porphyromonas asaccharolytica]